MLQQSDIHRIDLSKLGEHHSIDILNDEIKAVHEKGQFVFLNIHQGAVFEMLSEDDFTSILQTMHSLDRIVLQDFDDLEESYTAYLIDLAGQTLKKQDRVIPILCTEPCTMPRNIGDFTKLLELGEKFCTEIHVGNPTMIGGVEDGRPPYVTDWRTTIYHGTDIETIAQHLFPLVKQHALSKRFIFQFEDQP